MLQNEGEKGNQHSLWCLVAFFSVEGALRRKQESAMGVVYPCWLAILIFLVVGLLSGIRGISEARIRRRLRRVGIDTKAVVIGHWVTGSAYYVTYRYYHQGQRYKREEQVGSSRYKDWPWGTVIPVRYLPECPYVVRITSEGNHFLAGSVISLTFVLFTILGVIALGIPLW